MTRGARTQRCLLVTIALLATVALVMPVAASAATAARWPGRTITYWDASRDKVAVARAVAAWNRSGVRMRFVPASSQRRAQLLIRNSSQVPAGCGTGLATVGYPGSGRQATLNILNDPAPRDQACSWAGQTLVVAHELGHVLGLVHDDTQCSLMNSVHVNGIAPTHCYGEWTETNIRARTATWRCRIIEPFDVRSAIRRYGGAMVAMRRNPWCNLFSPLDAPASITGTWDESAQEVSLQLRRPAPKAIPSFLRQRATSPDTYEIYRSSGTCVTQHRGFTPYDPATGVIYRPWSVAAGAAQTVPIYPIDPGTWCFSAWARDALGKPGAGPATVTVEVPATVAATAIATRVAPSRARAAATDAPIVRPRVVVFDDA